MFVAFVLLVNAFVSSVLLFQCSTAKRPQQQRKSQRSGKSGKSSKSRRSRRSSRSSKSGRSSSRRSSRSSKRSGRSGRSRRSKRSKGSKKSVESYKVAKGCSDKKVRAAILADQKAAQDAIKPQEPVVQPIDISSGSNKVSYSNIRVIPHELSFRPIGGLKHVRVKNSTGKRTAFMVKCSDNMLFSINPVYGVIESDKDAQINILRENGESKHDKLVIITAAHPEKNKSAEETFADIYNTNSHNYNISVVPLLAQ